MEHGSPPGCRDTHGAGQTEGQPPAAQMGLQPPRSKASCFSLHSNSIRACLERRQQNPVNPPSSWSGVCGAHPCTGTQTASVPHLALEGSTCAFGCRDPRQQPHAGCGGRPTSRAALTGGQQSHDLDQEPGHHWAHSRPRHTQRRSERAVGQEAACGGLSPGIQTVQESGSLPRGQQSKAPKAEQPEAA